jgi:A/G-specific adenine glycosylase
VEVDAIQIRKFQKQVWQYFRESGRHLLPWRKTQDPYKVLVSELMLQQTQAGRVVPKYTSFVKRFPTLRALAKATLADVLREWQGLGYNRRAKFLHLLAREVVAKYNGRLPLVEKTLLTLPGVGPATASAIMAFAYNKPTTYIETNVRSVFLHHFFPLGKNVPDTHLLPLIQSAARGQAPREWNWALLDYGVYIKLHFTNPNRRSKHYALQSRFSGSTRQLRGLAVRLLSVQGRLSKSLLIKKLGVDSHTAVAVLDGLVRDGLISYTGGRYMLSDA